MFSENKLLITQSSKRIGFPRTEQWPFLMRKANYSDEVRRQLVPMDNPNIPVVIKEKVEVVLNKEDVDNQFFEIQVKRNHTRVEELKKRRSAVL